MFAAGSFQNANGIADGRRHRLLRRHDRGGRSGRTAPATARSSATPRVGGLATARSSSAATSPKPAATRRRSWRPTRCACRTPRRRHRRPPFRRQQRLQPRPVPARPARERHPGRARRRTSGSRTTGSWPRRSPYTVSGAPTGSRHAGSQVARTSGEVEAGTYLTGTIAARGSLVLRVVVGIARSSATTATITTRIRASGASDDAVRIAVKATTSATAPRQRQGSRDGDAGQPGDVAEVLVEAQHRGVAGLRPGVELGHPVLGGPVEGAALQVGRDPATTPVPAYGGQGVLAALGTVRVTASPAQPITSPP